MTIHVVTPAVLLLLPSTEEEGAVNIISVPEGAAVIFDGKKVIEATDDSFSEAGKAGVWTKADSVTLFDDFGFGPSR